jgi:hypothetical protein
MSVEINFIAVILAAVASMGVGFAWYHPIVLGKPWMKMMGYTEASMKETQKKMGKMYAISFVMALITAYVLSHVMTLLTNFFNYPALATGIMSAFWMWLGFIMPVQSTEVLFGGKAWKLFYINTGYQLASILVMGVVISLF